MKKAKLTRSLMAAVSIVALTAVMYGCVHDGDSDTVTEMPEPMPTPYETAKNNIAAAATAEAAQAAYDAVKDDVTAAEGDRLQAAVDARITALATMTRAAAQRMALMTAAGAIDTSDLSTAEAIAAANTAIAALQAALDAADDVSDADKAMYQSQLDTAGMAVREAQTGLDTAGRMMAQRMAISNSVTAARTAVGMVDDDATDAQVMAADNAVAALEMAIEGAADLPEGDTDVASAQGTLATLKGQLASAKTSRMAAMSEADRAEAAMMAATAAKLYAGISAQMGDGDLTNLQANDRDAGYNAAGTAILVSIGGGTAAAAAVTLSEDKDTMVADLHGWEGKRYADPAGGDMIEAMVYSNVEEPTQGRKFGNATPGTGDTRAYEYPLTAGVYNVAENTADAKIALTGVTRTAGTETFHLPDPNPGGTTTIIIPGSYHGVSGSYSCVPGTAEDGCSATVAAEGFTLSTGDDWTFTPSSAEARVMESADTAYASYGWWLLKAENDGPFTASAFHDFKGTAETVEIANLVAGTATYVGGAAGKYALASSTGGTNDAGHFTAMATLDAEFGDATAGNMITGTIDNFMGADGMARDWSVELNETTVGNDGVIAELITTATAAATVWTIGEDPAAGSGQWSGNLREEGDDGVPKVATGTFYTEYGTAGKMVGAFGANKEE